MFFSDRLLRRFGARGMLVIAMTTIGLRLLFYSLTTQPWVVLVIQLVHGLTFAAIYTAVCITPTRSPHPDEVHHPGHVQRHADGFGSAAGGLLGGLLLDRFSPGGMYPFQEPSC